VSKEIFTALYSHCFLGHKIENISAAKLCIKSSKLQISGKIKGGQFCFFAIDFELFKIKKVDNLKLITFSLLLHPFFGAIFPNGFCKNQIMPCNN